MIRTLVLVADGSEEMETVILVDVLRRAGWAVTLAGLNEGSVTASRGVRLVPDTTMDVVSLAPLDLLLLPGGLGGTEAFLADLRVVDLLQDAYAAGKTVVAICAAPQVLDAAGLLVDRRYTCYPGCEEGISDGTRVDEKVVIDDRVITSQGPGTAIDLALALITHLDSPEKSAEVAAGLLYDY